MNYEAIKQLSQSAYGRHFLTRSYSLELLVILYEFEQVDGIEQLYAMMTSKKSKMPAFLGFLNYLEDRQCIVKFTNEEKKSQRVVALTGACRAEIDAIFTQQDWLDARSSSIYRNQHNSTQPISL